jgi:hypothetical protein
MPDGVRRPVAVAIMALMLGLTTNLPAKDRFVRTRAGSWAERAAITGLGLNGRTLGSVGMGNIGAEVFRLAKPFDMTLIAHDPAIGPEQAAALGVELAAQRLGPPGERRDAPLELAEGGEGIAIQLLEPVGAAHPLVPHRAPSSASTCVGVILTPRPGDQDIEVSRSWSHSGHQRTCVSIELA